MYGDDMHTDNSIVSFYLGILLTRTTIHQQEMSIDCLSIDTICFQWYHVLARRQGQ